MATKSKKTAKKPVKKAVKKVVKKAAPKSKKPAPKKAVAKKPAPKKTVARKAPVKNKAAKKPAAKKAVSKPSAPKKEVKVEFKKHANNPVAQPRGKHKEDNRTRYSDRELNEFKALIVEKMEAARAELKYLNDQINRKDDNGTDDTENKFGSIEDGSVAMEREYLNSMALRQSTYLDHLEKAMMRIDNKTYGICRVTGKLIDKERLRAVPHATLSIEAKMEQTKQS